MCIVVFDSYDLSYNITTKFLIDHINKFRHGLIELNNLCKLGRILVIQLFVSGKDCWQKQTCGRGFGWCLKKFQKDDLAFFISCSNCRPLTLANRRWFFTTIYFQLIVPPQYPPEALKNVSPLPLTLLFCLEWISQSLAWSLVPQLFPLWFHCWSAGWDELLPSALKTTKCLCLPPSLPWPFEIIKITLPAWRLCHFIVNRCSFPCH